MKLPLRPVIAFFMLAVLFGCLAVAFLVEGCASTPAETKAIETAAIDVAKFFDGAVCAYEDTQSPEPEWAYLLCSFTGQPVGIPTTSTAVTIKRRVRVRKEAAAAFLAKHAPPG